MRRLQVVARLLIVTAFTVMAFASPPARGAMVLYGATAAGLAGELYVLDASTGGILRDVGPLNDANGLDYGITGLAYNAATGLLYGSSHNLSTANPDTLAKLVTIDPLTARVTVIGSFNAGNTGGRAATMSDLAFDANGILYGVGSVGGAHLYSINVATGQATVIGNSGLTSTSGGGVTISASGVVYGTPTANRFGTYDLATGVFTLTQNPAKPVGGAYAALETEGTSGSLYGLDLGPSPTLETELVIIDPATGMVSDLGPSVVGLDAIAFLPVPEPSSAALVAIASFPCLTRRRRN